MKKIMQKYMENQNDVQIFIRNKTFEGKIENVEQNKIHLVGEKFEYHLTLDHILGIGAKLSKEKRMSIEEKSGRVGFKSLS